MANVYLYNKISFSPIGTALAKKPTMPSTENYLHDIENSFKKFQLHLIATLELQ